jgi:hypothetical protein
MDPQYVDMQTNSKHNSAQLDALQGFEQNILKHHRNLGMFLLVYKLCVPRETTYDKMPQKSGNVSSSI